MDICVWIAEHAMLPEVRRGSENNTVVSPISINMVLNMVLARSTGHTLERMLEFFGYDSVSEINSHSAEMMAALAGADGGMEGPILSMINGVWVDGGYPLHQKYEKLLKDIFDCDAKNVDFATKVEEVICEINSWAKAASKDLIREIFKPRSLSSSTILLLANALYFKGMWVDKFDLYRTTFRNFYLLNGDKIRVPFMSSQEQYNYGSFDGFKVLKIPYKSGKLNSQFSMYFFLPDERDGWQKLVEKFKSNSKLLQQNFNLRKMKLDEIWIPKFKFSYGFDVIRAMEDTGRGLSLPLPFMENPEEFSDRPGDKPFFTSKIFQKIFIEIDEGDNEPAAIIYKAQCRSSMYKRKKTSFVADHPFIFMIKEELSDLIFFAGAILNPACH